MGAETAWRILTIPYQRHNKGWKANFETSKMEPRALTLVNFAMHSRSFNFLSNSPIYQDGAVYAIRVGVMDWNDPEQTHKSSSDNRALRIEVLRRERGSILR